MKKIINNPDNVVTEALEGFMFAYGKNHRKIDNINGVIRKETKDKVGIVTGGGSGHEPLFLGFVGEGLADGVAIGNVFTAPPPPTIQGVAEAVDSGKGVLFIYGNYAGDELNFDMAAELLEFEDVESRTVKVRDDVASAPAERKEDRRGIAGDVFVIKIAGAAAEKGFSLDEVTEVTQKACDLTYSMGVALSPGIIPSSGEPTFTIPDDKIEIGMGIHGEPGIERTKLMEADELTNKLMDKLIEESCIENSDEVVVLINGLGSTTLMELMIVNRRVAQYLDEKGISIYDADINNYCTTQEMAGLSITLMKLDDEIKEYYDAPASSAYYNK